MCNFNGILYRSLLRSLLEAALFWLLQTGCPEGAAYFTTKSAANKAIHQYSFLRRMCDLLVSNRTIHQYSFQRRRCDLLVANSTIHQYSFQRRSATCWYQIEQFINIHFSAVVRPVGIK